MDNKQCTLSITHSEKKKKKKKKKSVVSIFGKRSDAVFRACLLSTAIPTLNTCKERTLTEPMNTKNVRNEDRIIQREEGHS